MKIIVAGATGAIGRRLVPLLVDAGHDVAGITRSASRSTIISDAGAHPVVADVLDAEAIRRAIRGAAPDVVVHQLTAIPARYDPRRFAEAFAATNVVRTVGTRNLVAAAVAAGSRRIVAQIIAQAYAPVGSWIKDEDDPLYDNAPPVFADIFSAIIELERTVIASGLEATVLRYGNFYGPGTAYAADGFNADLVRQQQLPVAGGGVAHWSFIHVDDAARATVAAVERPVTGIFNIVDDDPAAVADWLPAYAKALGAPEPARTPPPRGAYGIHGMMHARAASNRKARERLGWAPVYASWRDGFEADLAS